MVPKKMVAAAPKAVAKDEIFIVRRKKGKERPKCENWKYPNFMRRSRSSKKLKSEKVDDLSFRRATDIFSVYVLYQTLPPSRIGNDSSSNCVCGLFSSRLVLDIYWKLLFSGQRRASQLPYSIRNWKSIHSHRFLCPSSYKMYQLSTQNEAGFSVLHTNKIRSFVPTFAIFLT